MYYDNKQIAAVNNEKVISTYPGQLSMIKRRLSSCMLCMHACLLYFEKKFIIFLRDPNTLRKFEINVFKSLSVLSVAKCMHVMKIGSKPWH